jgi:peptide/nickel transport system substrate-binding protein
MAAIGIDVSINILEWASFDERVIQNHNFQIAITSDFQGPEVSAIAQSIATDGFLNFSGFYNPEVDELLAAALGVVTFEARAPYYHRVQQIMREYMPFYIISEWVGYYPHWAFVRNHPGSPEIVDQTGWAEFTYVWFDR